MSRSPLMVHPIGFIRTDSGSRYALPRQPGTAQDRTTGTITLESGKNFEQALEDLEGMDYVWIIFWFDRTTGWKPKVLPPAKDRTKRGVFATRSPHRPNPIGLSLCRLLAIEGRTLTIENPDLLNGTPIIDIKPYLPHAEARPDASSGWIAQHHERTEPSYSVVISRPVRSQIGDLPVRERKELLIYLRSVLGRDPFPHAYRRIKKISDHRYTIAVRYWRFIYLIDGRTIRVVEAVSVPP